MYILGPNKPVGTSGKNPLTELADGYQTVANRPNVIKGPQPAVEKRNIEGQKFPYEELGAVGGYDGQVDDQKVPNDSFDDIPERMGAPPEEMPLLKDPTRHNGGAPHRLLLQYSEGVAIDSDDAQSHLLQIRKSILHNDEKSGAKSKTNLPKYTRPLHGTKSERTSSAERIPTANRFKNCTFKKCSGPALVTDPINDDSSLYTRQYNAVDLRLNLPPNDLDDGKIDMSEPSASINVSGLLNETKSKDERKHSSAKQKTLSVCNDLDPDSLKPYTADKDEIFMEKVVGHDKNIGDYGMKNDKDITFEKSKLDDKQSEKKLSLEISKPDIGRENEDNLKNTKTASGTPSPASSNGSKSGSRRKIKLWKDKIKEESKLSFI